MNNPILPIAAAAATLFAAAPAYAETVQSAPAVAKSTVAFGDRTLRLVDANGSTVGTLVGEGAGSYRLQLIGSATAQPVRTGFHVDLRRALSPQQMNAAYDRETDRLFNIQHSS